MVSLPCWELFDAQDQAYRDSVLPPAVTARVACEAGIVQGWETYLGFGGRFVGMSSFGASAPGELLFEHFGITAENVVKQAQELLRSNRSARSPGVLQPVSRPAPANLLTIANLSTSSVGRSQLLPGAYVSWRCVFPALSRRSSLRPRWPWPPRPRNSRRAGKTVYDFSLGEPDFTTPEHICQAAVDGDAGRPHPLHRRQRHSRAARQPSPSSSRSGTAWTTRRPGRRLQRRQALAAQRLHRAAAIPATR